MKEDGKKGIRRITDSDFPHPDGVWPDSQTFIEEQLGHLPPATRRKIVRDNATKLYGFEID